EEGGEGGDGGGGGGGGGVAGEGGLGPQRPADPGEFLPRPGRRTRHTSGSRRLLLRSSVVVDGLVPVRVEKPSTAEEVAGLLRAAAEAGEAIVPVGGGRALGFGNPLERFDVALEMLGLNRVIEMSQGDMTV